MNIRAVFFIAPFLALTAVADQKIADQYPGSALYSKPVEVVPGVWSAIGATAPATYENSGHNNNYTFIQTGQGIVVVNSGSYLLAEALHKEIRNISDEPVVLVINENGQGHAALGNGYWKEKNIPILAHRDAIDAFRKHGHESLLQLRRITKEKAEMSDVVQATVSFTNDHVVELGDRRVEVRWLGPSHSKGDIVVWLPAEKLVVSGDMAFHERLLPIFEDTDTRQWLETWEAFENLNALYVIPGHGHPTNMAQVRRYTRDYLIYIRDKVRELLEQDGDLQAAFEIDQAPYSHLDTFDELAKINAGRVFEQMEFE